MRVSTQEQCPDRQVDGLRGRCDRLFLETVSAVSPRRPVYEKVIEQLRSGDTLVVWDLDRAFRSVLDAVTQAERLREKGVEFEIVSLQIDTATPAGMLVYIIMSAIAEFERRLLAQRTREGLASARLRGARLGRPPKLDASQVEEARRVLAARAGTTASVARELGVAPWTLTRSLRQQREAAQPLPRDRSPHATIPRLGMDKPTSRLASRRGLDAGVKNAAASLRSRPHLSISADHRIIGCETGRRGGDRYRQATPSGEGAKMQTPRLPRRAPSNARNLKEQRAEVAREVAAQLRPALNRAIAASLPSIALYLELALKEAETLKAAWVEDA